MDYRMEKPGMELRPSLLGYGCMRFPRKKDRTVDEEKVIREAQRLGTRLVEKSGLGNSQWGKKMPFLHI